MNMANQQLRNERRSRALSQEEMAEVLGTTSGNVSRWERGITFPSPYYCRKLCDLFQKSPQELFPDSFSDRDTTVALAPNVPQMWYQPDLAPGKTREEARISSVGGDVFVPWTTFCFNMALTDTREFFGRVREKTILLDRTLKGESTSIVGPRRVGKSWLLNYLRLVAPIRLGSHVRLLLLDGTAPSCATLPGFVAEVLRGLGGVPVSGTSVTGLFELLERHIQALRAKNQIPILCLDEFEAFCKLPDVHLAVLEHLRALIQSGLGVVLVSQRPLLDVVAALSGEQQRASPFFNVFRQITLRPFTVQEALSFVTAKGSQAHFSQEEQDYLLRYGRQEDQDLWPPLRLQLTGTLLQEDKALAVQENPVCYRPQDPDYWQDFARRVEEVYQGSVR